MSSKEKKVICPYCNKEAIWCENKEVYGKNYGKSYMCYSCKDCDAYVGCHNNTREPLGTLANYTLRLLRRKAHKKFDRLWKSKQSRKYIYGEISKDFGKEVHIGWSDYDDCKKIIEWVDKREEELSKLKD